MRTCAQGEAVPASRRGRARAAGDRRPPRSRSLAAQPRAARRRARGHVRARGQARRRQAGPDAAGDRRGQRDDDRGRLPDGHLRRRPGRDQGRAWSACRRSPTTSARRSSGSACAANTRMACCARVQGPVSVALTPDKADGAQPEPGPRLQLRPSSIERVVVIGNGIAGVTAADHVRRRHPGRRDRPRSPRSRTTSTTAWASRASIYGRSAMQGLYLNPDAWYDERDITTWLNTRALRIDRDAPPGRARHRREAALRPADPGDRLERVRARRSTASARRARSCCARPTTRSRCAPSPSATARAARSSPAAACSGSRPPTRCTSSGCRTTVLERSDRLLRRQLDARAAELLRALPRGPRAGDRDRAPRPRPSTANGRVRRRDARRRPLRCDADLLLVAAGITPNVELAARRRAARSTAACSSTSACAPSDPAIFAAGDVAEFDGQRARPVADRRRAGRGRGRQRGRRRQGLRAARCR